MRTHYNVVDLLRFHRFANEHLGLKPVELLKLYEITYPELSEEQKMENLESKWTMLFKMEKRLKMIW